MAFCLFFFCVNASVGFVVLLRGRPLLDPEKDSLKIEVPVLVFIVGPPDC